MGVPRRRHRPRGSACRSGASGGGGACKDGIGSCIGSGDGIGSDGDVDVTSMPARMSTLSRIKIHVCEPHPPLMSRSDVDASLRELLPQGLRLNDATAAFIRASASVTESCGAALGWSLDYARAMDAIACVMPRVLALMDGDPALVVYAHVSPATRHLAYMAIPTNIKQELVPGTVAFPPGVVVFHKRRSMFFSDEDFLDGASAQRLLRQVVNDSQLTCSQCGDTCRAHTACCRQCAAPMCGACDRATRCPMCSCELAPPF